MVEQHEAFPLYLTGRVSDQENVQRKLPKGDMVKITGPDWSCVLLVRVNGERAQRG